MSQKEMSQLASRAETLQAYIRKLRMHERSLAAREKSLSEMYQMPNSSVEGVRKSMCEGLPMDLVPLNIGNIEKAAWNFWFPVNFLFEDVQFVTNQLRQTAFFQVDQEAAFIMTHVSWNMPNFGLYSIPFNVSMIDRQSQRQLQNNPVPITSFGQMGLQTKLTTPYLLMPSAQFEVQLQCTQIGSADLGGLNDFAVQMSFHGIRMRVDDASEILSTIYKARGE